MCQSQKQVRQDNVYYFFLTFCIARRFGIAICRLSYLLASLLEELEGDHTAVNSMNYNGANPSPF